LTTFPAFPFLILACRSRADAARGRASLRNGAAEAGCSLQHAVVVMEDMEEYTINDDLRACGLPGDDEDDLASSGEALFSSSAAPISVDGGDGAGAAGGAGAGTPPGQSTMPSSMPSVNTGSSIRGKRAKSGA
jgi:hypothetical protein